MNSLILVLAFVGCAVAQLIQVGRFVPPQGGARQIGIVRQSQDVNYDGNYQWSYETENGISASEQGQPKSVPEGVAVVAQGQFQFTAPDGTPVSIQYIADENGFQPQGNILPTPPPIPLAIQRSLEYNAAHPEPQQNSAFPQRRFK